MRKAEKQFETTLANGDKVTLLCVRPNQDVLDGARLEYNIKYAAALRNGALTKAEAEDIIDRRHLWSETHETKHQALLKEVHDATIALRGTTDKIKGKALAKQIGDMRAKLNKLHAGRSDILNKTCENYAEAAQNQYLLVRCILEPVNRQPYWENLESFKIMENSILINDASAELFLFLMDMTMDDAVATPEGQWLVKNGLKDLKTGFWIKEGRLYTDDGKLVNDLGEYITEAGVRCDIYGYPLEVIDAKEAPVVENAAPQETS